MIKTGLADFFGLVATKGIAVTFIIVVSVFVWYVINLIIDRLLVFVEDDGTSSMKALELRLHTLSDVLKAIAHYSIVIIAILMILGQLGVNLTPILAGAGILGLAISLGAQSLFKDILTGIFILFENQFILGEFVKIGDVNGTVEKMNLRTTTLRSINGDLHIIPNGEIRRISNSSREWARIIIDIGISYKENLNRVFNILKNFGENFSQNYSQVVLEPLEILGVENFTESQVIIKIGVKVLPSKQLELTRTLRKIIKETFDQENIEMPYIERTYANQNKPKENVAKNSFSQPEQTRFSV